MGKSIDKTANLPTIDTFSKGRVEGFKIGVESITPVMILGYTLVYILQVAGLMILLGCILTSVMGVFGLPGKAFAVLILAFFTKVSGCTTAAIMYTNGKLTLGQASMLLPACILIGALIGHYARTVLVAGINKKWHTILLIILLFDTALPLIVIRMILMAMGIA